MQNMKILCAYKRCMKKIVLENVGLYYIGGISCYPENLPKNISKFIIYQKKANFFFF